MKKRLSLHYFPTFTGYSSSHLRLHATNCSTFSALADSSHQRAGGNLRYYEKLLYKQLSEMDQAYEPASEEPIQLGTYNRPKDHLPERESYEALCRGEGLEMVRYRVRMYQKYYYEYLRQIIL